VAKAAKKKPAPVSTAKTVSLESLKTLTDRVRAILPGFGESPEMGKKLGFFLTGAFVCVMRVMCADAFEYIEI